MFSWFLYFSQHFSSLPELISPEDLLQACALWEKIDVYAQKNLQPFSGSSLGQHEEDNDNFKNLQMCLLVSNFHACFL